MGRISLTSYNKYVGVECEKYEFFSEVNNPVRLTFNNYNFKKYINHSIESITDVTQNTIQSKEKDINTSFL